MDAQQEPIFQKTAENSVPHWTLFRLSPANSRSRLFVLKTHRPHHRSRHHVRHFLNLLPVAQRVRNRLTFGDAADAVLHDGDALFGLLRGALLAVDRQCFCTAGRLRALNIFFEPSSHAD